MLSFVLDRIFVVAGALLFLQIPNFFVHYTQRLGGHASELKLQIDAMYKIAAQSGKTLPEFISKFQSSVDMDISLQGSLMKGMLVRYMDLSDAYEAMLHATPLTRPLIFISNLQWNVAWMTWQDFTWGISFSLEGLVYGFIGMIFGSALCWLFIKPLKLACKKIAK